MEPEIASKAAATDRAATFTTHIGVYKEVRWLVAMLNAHMYILLRAYM